MHAPTLATVCLVHTPPTFACNSTTGTPQTYNQSDTQALASYEKAEQRNQQQNHGGGLVGVTNGGFVIDVCVFVTWFDGSMRTYTNPA